MQNKQTSAKQEDVQTYFIKKNVDLKVKEIGRSVYRSHCVRLCNRFDRR